MHTGQGERAGKETGAAVLFCQALKVVYVIRLIVPSPTGTSATDLCSQGEGSDVKIKGTP